MCYHVYAVTTSQNSPLVWLSEYEMLDVSCVLRTDDTAFEMQYEL